MIRLTVNGTSHDLDVDGQMPLLWALRDVLGLTGTKFGCGIVQRGSCKLVPAFEIYDSQKKPSTASAERPPPGGGVGRTDGRRGAFTARSPTDR